LSAQNFHPFVLAFDNLLALRQYAATDPIDAAASFASFAAFNLMHSSSQLFQDLIIMVFLKGKRNKYFVEIGATNGVDLSNTLILERDF
jgi:hypothetical protein